MLRTSSRVRRSASVPAATRLIGASMSFLPPLPSSARLPGMTVFTAGFALVFAAAVYFFAWNWYGLPEAARFLLTGGASALCLALSFLAERKNRRSAAALALLGSALSTGIFWVTFGQIFQSGATAWELCLVWAACVLPLFLLRGNASLWNLLVTLLFIASCVRPFPLLPTSFRELSLLPPLITAAGSCALALFPPLRRRSPCGLNAWLALPLTLLAASATALCVQLILFYPDIKTGLPEAAAGPAALAIVLAAALRFRHAPALCEAALALVVLLNALILRGFDHLSSVALAFLFTAANIFFASLLALALPRLRQKNSRRPLSPGLFSLVPSILGGFFAAVSFIALITLTFLDNAVALHSAGLACMICGIVLWRRRGTHVFRSVLSSALVSGGSLCFHLSLFDYAFPVIMASVWAASLFIYLLMNSPIPRFFAMFWALVTSLVLLPQSVSAGVPLYLLLAFLLFLPLVAAAFGRFPRGMLRPAALACLSVLPALPLSMPSPAFEETTERILITIAALNLAFLLLRQLLPPFSAALPRPGKLAAGIAALLPVWFFSPLESLFALNLIFAGVTNAPNHDSAENKDAPAFDKVLTGMGIVILAASLVLFYYAIDHYFPLETMAMAALETGTHFLSMTMAAGIPGLCLLFLGMQMERRPRPETPEKPESPPLPSLLRHGLPFALIASLMTAVACTAIVDRKKLLQTGDEILLSLRPRDPRAFMIGDYMDLTYDIERYSPVEGPLCMPLAVDELGIARPIPDAVKQGDCTGVSAPAVLVDAPSHGFTRLRLPHRYYFEQGLARVYADAAFAVLRCDRNNNCLLKGLADADRRPLLPPRK